VQPRCGSGDVRRGGHQRRAGSGSAGGEPHVWSEAGKWYPATLAMPLFDSSGVNKYAAW
jgi:hypothetical protein